MRFVSSRQRTVVRVVGFVGAEGARVMLVRLEHATPTMSFNDPMRRSRFVRLPSLLAVLAVVLLVVACGGEQPDAPDMGAPADTDVAPRTVDDEPALAIPDDAPTVAFLGDSIAAGLHLARDEAFPARIQRRLATDGRPFHLVNAGVSGDTTAGGVARIDWLLGQEPDVVVIELGFNDGFRGVPVETVEENLRTLVSRIRDAGARPVLLGIRLPPNYGSDYAGAFAELYPQLAEELDVPFVDHFMDGVAGFPELNLPDGIHPTPEGHERLADNVAPAVRRVLELLPRGE